MSWGERSCKSFGSCKIATMATCNVNCRRYKWDGVTKTDSKKQKTPDSRGQQKTKFVYTKPRLIFSRNLGRYILRKQAKAEQKKHDKSIAKNR